MVKNHWNLCTFNKSYQLIAISITIEAKDSFFVKSLNFQSHGNSLTVDAARNAVRTSVKIQSVRKLSDSFRDLARPRFCRWYQYICIFWILGISSNSPEATFWIRKLSSNRGWPNNYYIKLINLNFLVIFLKKCNISLISVILLYYFSSFQLINFNHVINCNSCFNFSNYLLLISVIFY